MINALSKSSLRRGDVRFNFPQRPRRAVCLESLAASLADGDHYWRNHHILYSCDRDKSKGASLEASLRIETKTSNPLN